MHLDTMDGGEAERADLYQKIGKSTTDSSYRFASGGGALYRFVKPELVVDTNTQSVEESVAAVISYLESGGYLGS